MKRVLYIGGFEMPDCNAAAQRVLAIGKLLKLCSYEVRFCGLSRIGKQQGEIEGFTFTNFSYPKNISSWLEYLIFSNKFKTEIKLYHPDIVILYNHPAFAIERLAKYCHKHNIRALADVTEWYKPEGSLIFNTIKGYDTTRRMKYSHLKLDGLICISNYLYNYYSEYNIPIINIPPLIDLEQPKWHQTIDNSTENIKILYAGSPGVSKDRLDIIVSALKAVSQCPKCQKFEFDIIGITKEQYCKKWGKTDVPNFVNFIGRIPHEEVIKRLISCDYQIFLRPETLPNKAGFPTKFVETIASRTIPITNLNSNLSDYLKDSQNGFVIKAFDVHSVITALLMALTKTKDEIMQMKKHINPEIFDFRSYKTSFCQFLNLVVDKQ